MDYIYCSKTVKLTAVMVPRQRPLALPLKARKSRQSKEKLTVFVCSTGKNLGSKATVLS
jgi:hypothetical protein